jgi:hypothetical protein
MGYPPPYDNYETRKRLATLFQPYISASYNIIMTMCEGISMIDAQLYSEEFRNILKDALQQADVSAEIIEYLQSADHTRQHLYRFFLKGSNVVPFLNMYLAFTHSAEMYSILANNFPKDWDTTILINPELSHTEFTIIYETLIKHIQLLLVRLSNIISDNTSGYLYTASLAHAHGKSVIDNNSEFEQFREHDIRFVATDKSPRHILLRNETTLVNKKTYAQQFGPVGPGTIVSSDRNGAGIGKFYLARILSNFIARRNIVIPVELLDISINYQNDDLRYAWESHSEYHIVFNKINMRVLSPTSLYADLVKCIRNAKNSTNQTRKNKIPDRIARIYSILDTMIVPYANRNTIIRQNLQRHLESNTLVGNVFRQLNKTMRNRSVPLLEDM